jgi:nitrite reductase (NADH) small subunit
VSFHPACALDALSSGPQIAAIDGRDIAVLQVGGEVFAIDNLCPHRGGPLGAGDLSGYLLHCPLHAWSFDVRTGLSASNPGAGVPCHRTRVVAGRVEVEPR